MKDPAGIINLEELDRISEISGAGDGDVDPQSSPVIATILVSVISIEATVTAFSFIIECQCIYKEIQHMIKLKKQQNWVSLNSMEVRATMPACQKSESNKWVIAHGLVSYACLNCNYYFM